MSKTSKERRMKKWLSENWDEMIVYLFALAGAIWALMNVARQSGATFHLDVFSTGMAVMGSLGATWLAENRGMAAAQKLGVISDAKAGRRKNIVLRLGLGFAFGFLIQSSLPQIIEALTKVVPGLIQGSLGIAP